MSASNAGSKPIDSVPKKNRRGGGKPPRAETLIRAAKLFDEGMDANDIAKVMDVEPGTAKGYLSAIRKMRGVGRKVIRAEGPIAGRFAIKVDRNGPIHPRLGTACHMWIGAVANEYGSIGDTRGEFGPPGVIWSAHKIAYALAHGTMPDRSVVVRHKCDVKRCVNPDHLELGSYSDNIQDSIARGRFITEKRLAAGRNRKCGACGERGHRRNKCPKREAA